MKKIIFILSLFIVGATLPNNVFAQTGNTGMTNYDYEQLWLCDSASSTTFYRLTLYRLGFSAVVVGNFKPDGTSYTPTSSIKSGPCMTGSVSYPDSSYNYEILEMCDEVSTFSTTNFIRLYQVSVHNLSGNRVLRVIGDFNLTTGASYTPTGTVRTQWCFQPISPSTTSYRRQFTNVTGSFGGSDHFFGFSILNVGTERATITVGTHTTDLYPGEEFYCNTDLALNDRAISCNFGFSYDCTINGGTTLHYVGRKP